MTTREPWSRFFWGDWRSDPKLRCCSYGARGLWMDILAIMHEAEPYGHLLINGHAPTPKQIAQATGGTANDVNKLMGELLAAGVPSVNGDRIWFSRRMVRDKQRQITNKTNGKGGGNPILKSRITDSDNRLEHEPDNGPDKAGDKAHVRASHLPEAINPPIAPLSGAESETHPEAESEQPRGNGARHVVGARRKPKTLIPDDWQPSPEDRAFALARGLDPDKIALEFVLYWKREGKPMADWSATFRQRCLQVIEWRAEKAAEAAKPARREPLM